MSVSTIDNETLLRSDATTVRACRLLAVRDPYNFPRPSILKSRVAEICLWFVMLSFIASYWRTMRPVPVPLALFLKAPGKFGQF